MAESTTVKGRAGEDRAVAQLVREGYRVVARNVRAARCEIDIVASDGEYLCFIEVRRRDEVDDALASINGKKQARIIKGATAYIAGIAPVPMCRFDVVVVGNDRVEIVKNAFQARPVRGRE